MTAHHARALSDRWGVLASTVQTRMYEVDLDQRSLAERANVSPSVVADLQRGTATNYQLGTLLDVATGLDLHPLGLVAVLAGDDAAQRLGVASAHGHRTGGLSRSDLQGAA